MKNKIVALLFAGMTLLTSQAQAALIDVDLELQLLVDVSGSISSSEYTLQKTGYINAFRSTSVINAIESGALGSIAVQYLEWSSSNQQAVLVDWFLIDSAATANAFADALALTMRAFSGGTVIGSAIDYGKDLFTTNLYNGTRNVMDVSGDGSSAAGSTAAARDAALAAGVDTINGITIGSESGLQGFYVDNVIGGSNPFHMHATTFEDFGSAVEQKLVREIATSVPEPGSIAMLAFGLMMLAGARKKFQA